jgi:hypothetical protein
VSVQRRLLHARDKLRTPLPTRVLLQNPASNGWMHATQIAKEQGRCVLVAQQSDRFARRDKIQFASRRAGIAMQIGQRDGSQLGWMDDLTAALAVRPAQLRDGSATWRRTAADRSATAQTDLQPTYSNPGGSSNRFFGYVR